MKKKNTLRNLINNNIIPQANQSNHIDLKLIQSVQIKSKSLQMKIMNKMPILMRSFEY